MKSNRRKLILGIDEAGYGPNLGPLVIVCSVWLVDDLHDEESDKTFSVESLVERMKPLFQPSPCRSTISHIPLGDSKKLYSSNKSIDSLIWGVRYWLNQSNAFGKVESFQELIETVAFPCASRLDRIPWYKLHPISDPSKGFSPIESFRDFESILPMTLVRAADQKRQELRIQFLDVAAKVIDEERFNREVIRLGNKATLLSHISLDLAKSCIEKHTARLRDEDFAIHVYFDKHGGRNRYQSLLMDTLPDCSFETECESTSRSDYRSRWNGRELRWSFIAKGDRLIASAISSMTAKWIREGLMGRLNQFWLSHQPDLKPTAGYPEDAKRFRQAIESIVQQLGYPCSIWWRSR